MSAPISPLKNNIPLSPALNRFKQSLVDSPPAPTSALRVKDQVFVYTSTSPKALFSRAVQLAGGGDGANAKENAFVAFQNECILTFGESIVDQVYNRLHLNNAKSITAKQASDVLTQLENELSANPHLHPLYAQNVSVFGLPAAFSKKIVEGVMDQINNTLKQVDTRLDETFIQDIKRNPMKVENEPVNYSDNKFSLNPDLCHKARFDSVIQDKYSDLVAAYPNLSRNLSWLMTQTIPNQFTAQINGNTEDLTFMHLNEMRLKGEVLSALSLQGELDLEVMCQFDHSKEKPTFEINFSVAKAVNSYFDVSGVLPDSMISVNPDASHLMIKINLEYVLPEVGDASDFGTLKILDSSAYQHTLAV